MVTPPVESPNGRKLLSARGSRVHPNRGTEIEAWSK